MKYYCIEPATKDKDGVAVLPTMGKPRWRDTGSSSAYERKMQFQKEEFKWDAHIRSLEKFPTSCDRVGWFEATEKHEGFSYSFSHEMGERAKWEVITKEEYEKARPTYRRKFIVPQSEEKVLASVPNWEVSNDPLVNKFLNEKNMIPYDQKITDLLEDFSKWQQAKEAWRKIEIYKEEGERYKKAYEELSEQVREIVGRTWEAGQQYGYYDANNANAGDIPDKETFINTLFPSGRT
jgi:hypothetical protein